MLVADGAMGTMLQSFGELSLEEDFQNLEGCNEVLNTTRPDIVREVHRAYLEAGSDCIETNSFGTNLAALNEYGIVDRLEELAEASARIAREAADEFSTEDKPRFVLGSVGPGTKLPTLGHVTFAEVRDAYQLQVSSMIKGGIDAVLIETCQDLLQAKAAVIAAKRARAEAGVELPILVNVTVETTGTMLLGSEIGAALVTLEALGIDAIGLNCATGPAEMSEHLRHLSRRAGIAVGAMPNAGLPELTADGARYPLGPEGLAEALGMYLDEFGLALIGGCCGTTPEHIRLLAEGYSGRPVVARTPQIEEASSSLYIEVPFDQDASYLNIGERTNANGSKQFREAMLAGNWEECVEIAKSQARDGAHVLDLCVDYVGRDGSVDMSELAFRLSTAVTLPIVLDSTEPHVLEAGLERLAGRSIINSVNYEDGDGPESRFGRIMPMVREHGAAVVALTIDEEGQARTAEWKVRVASRLIDDLVENWGMNVGDILVDTLTFPIATGQEETRKDGIETIEAIRELKRRYPGVRTTLGLSNISFGLNPAARIVLNSVFLHECVQAGLDSAIVHSAKILPMDRIPEEQRQVALDMVYDRRTEGYDPLSRFLEMFEGVTAASARQSRAAELAALPLAERLQRRIIDGEGKGLSDDLEEALGVKPALDIINDDLLAGMKVVGELFGSGKMQLPFVLQSAEVMKTAVAYLEPHMEKTDGSGKGTLVLATVRGDVHDIGKNLVNIMLEGAGFEVIDLGVQVAPEKFVSAIEEHKPDIVGMSAFLTTTMPMFKANINALTKAGLREQVIVMVGGAPVTQEYADAVGADGYAADASATVKRAKALLAQRRSSIPA